jgi:hypothetical protein
MVAQHHQRWEAQTGPARMVSRLIGIPQSVDIRISAGRGLLPDMVGTT